MDRIPDVRDGLTREERVVLWVLKQTQDELGGRNVPTAMLYGRVVEYIDIRVDDLQRILQRLTGRGLPKAQRRSGKGPGEPL
ncbi:MAG: hypothetical protein JRH11_05775 [Deltaproteobacteria bacterium]|nr:hypothetical protein [Deltaproteobacteria bacterium]